MAERSFEEIAELVYGRGRTQQPAPDKQPPDPPAAEPASPRPADVVRTLIGEDTRLLAFLEEDIQRMEQELLADEQAVARNRGTED